MSTSKRNPGKIVTLNSEATIPDGSCVVVGANALGAGLPAGASPTSVMLLGLARREGGGSYASGDPMDVVVDGIESGIASDGSITTGDRVTSGGTDGKLIKANPGSGVNCTYVGIALATPASGDRFPVLVCPGIMQG
jgi:hypothetical protein